MALAYTLWFGFDKTYWFQVLKRAFSYLPSPSPSNNWPSSDTKGRRFFFVYFRVIGSFSSSLGGHRVEKTQCKYRVYVKKGRNVFCRSQGQRSFCSHIRSHFLNSNFPSFHFSLKLMYSPQVLPTRAEHMVLLMCNKTWEKSLKPALFWEQSIFPINSPMIYPCPLGASLQGLAKH